MAAVAFVYSEGADVGQQPRYSVARLATGDTSTAIMPGIGFMAGCLQIVAGTMTLQKSNDGLTWFTVKDTALVDIATVTAGMYEFATAALYLRILATTGPVTAHLVPRG